MSAAAENEKKFEYFLEFPQEVQMMVVEEMTPEDRCRFTRCSKSSFNKVKASRNHVYSLKLWVNEEMRYPRVNIKVRFDEHDEAHIDDKCGFCLVFEEKPNNKKGIKYQKLDSTTLWGIDLDDSADVIRLGFDNFKNRLQFYQNKIRMLDIMGTIIREEFIDFQFDVQSLANLRELRTEKNRVDPIQFLSKIHHPLKALYIDGREPDEFTAHLEAIYQVQDILYVPRLELTIEQFLNLSANDVLIRIGSLTVENIYDFVKSWQNGTYNGRMKDIQWKIRDANFDAHSLFRSLRGNSSSRVTTVAIKRTDSDETAVISYNEYYLNFRIESENS